MRRRGKVIGAKSFEQIIRNFSTEFFALISDEIKGGNFLRRHFIAETTSPVRSLNKEQEQKPNTPAHSEHKVRGSIT